MTATDVATTTSRPEQLPPKTIDLDAIEEATRMLLRALGQGDKDEVMTNTPRRVAELYAEIINPPFVDIESEFKVYPNPNPEPQLITVLDVHYVSMCEHHLAPAFGVGYLAYDAGPLVAGYSKLKKALNYLARQPTLNERLVVDAVDFLEERLQPEGIALVLRSSHTCLALKANAPSQEVVTVSDFRGSLAASPRYDAFWSMVNANNATFLGR